MDWDPPYRKQHNMNRSTTAEMIAIYKEECIRRGLDPVLELCQYTFGRIEIPHDPYFD